VRSRIGFRSRVTLAVAVAFAVAVAAASAVAYVGVRSTLRGDVDASLRQRVQRVATSTRGASVDAGPAVADLDQRRARLGPPEAYFQVLEADGTVIKPPGEPSGLPVTARDRAVAAGDGGTYFSDATVGGAHLRIITAPLRDGAAVQAARPVGDIDATLHHLSFLLLLVAGGGVALAGALGWTVARTALRPVDRLSATLEHVAATHDLSQRVEVAGNDELARLAGRFNEMLEALEESRRAQRQLVADASHELRTPLTSLRTNIEVLARSDHMPPVERARLLDDLVSQLEELTVLVGDLVDLAREEERVDAGPAGAGAAEDVRLDAVVERAVDRARRHAPTLSFRSDLAPVVVHGVPERIDRAVANLLDNAIKWSPPGQVVEVTVEAGEVTVRDHGPGIDAADLPFVFDRFYRAPTARGLPGSGLGLAIVRQVAEAHGGSVSAARAPGGGTVLRLRLVDAGESKTAVLS